MRPNHLKSKIFFSLLCALIMASGCKKSSSSAAAVATVAATPTATPAATATPTGNVTATPTATPNPTATPFPSGTVTALIITGPTTALTNTCVPLILKGMDSNGNNVATDLDVQFALMDDPNYSSQFFSNSDCSTGLFTGTLLTGQHQYPIYYQNYVPTALVLHANMLPGSSGVNYALTLTPIAVASVGSLQIGGAGTPCRLLEIGTYDANGSVVVESISSPNLVNLVITSSLGATHFYSDASCSVVVTSTTIGAGSGFNTTPIYLGTNTTPQSIHFTMSYLGSTPYPDSLYIGP